MPLPLHPRSRALAGASHKAFFREPQAVPNLVHTGIRTSFWKPEDEGTVPRVRGQAGARDRLRSSIRGTIRCERHRQRPPQPTPATHASTVLVLTVAVPVCRSALPDARIPKALQGSSVRAIEHAMHRQRVNATSRARTAPASHSHGYVCAVYIGWSCSCMPHCSPRALLVAPAPYPCHRFARGPQQRAVAKAPPVVPLAW